MSASKIIISEEEMSLVNNTEWILTKQRLIQKVCDLFGLLNVSYQQRCQNIKHLFPPATLDFNGKISKGENYQSLPYVMFDYPALYKKENILVIRTMFWWGNFFSITLHLSGNYKRRLMINADTLTWLAKKEYRVCINQSEWEHHFEADNYIPAASLSDEQSGTILKKPFIKIAKQLSLLQWDNAEVFLNESFQELVEFLQINYQVDEINPSPVTPTVDFDL